MKNFIELTENTLILPKEIKLVEQEIRLLFKAIEKASNINEAEFSFKRLENIQFVLAKAIFKNNLNVSSFLRKFVSDFDRIDDNELKNFKYQEIKSKLIKNKGK